MTGVGWEADVTSRDPTLDAVGMRCCAIRRGMSKKRATAIFDLSLRVGPPLRNGARETREKTRKGMRGVSCETYVTSRDPTLNAVDAMGVVRLLGKQQPDK
jgi:hypothetical protein